MCVFLSLSLPSSLLLSIFLSLSPSLNLDTSQFFKIFLLTISLLTPLFNSMLFLRPCSADALQSKPSSIALHLGLGRKKTTPRSHSSGTESGSTLGTNPKVKGKILNFIIMMDWMLLDNLISTYFLYFYLFSLPLSVFLISIYFLYLYLFSSSPSIFLISISFLYFCNYCIYSFSRTHQL